MSSTSKKKINIAYLKMLLLTEFLFVKATEDCVPSDKVKSMQMIHERKVGRYTHTRINERKFQFGDEGVVTKFRK